MTEEKNLSLWSLPVIVCAIGYFVDIYDFVIFAAVRKDSLASIGVTAEAMTAAYVFIFNWQMVGVVLGGIFWGMLADKIGRIRALFGSIFIYSLASMASAYPYSVEVYALIRFVAGFGLAGEIGGAMTLVSEIFPKHKRGYAATIISAVGFSGALVAAKMSSLVSWQVAYILGGVMGFILLFLRVKMSESMMFTAVQKDKDVSKANLRLFLWPVRRLLTYLACMLVGVPIFFLISILVNLAPEVGASLGAASEVKVALSMFWCYLGLILGSLTAGWLSSRMQSHRKSILIFLLLMSVCVAVLLLSPPGMWLGWFRSLYAALGFSIGYTALFYLLGAEQYGTNVRATVATTLPNFMRASAIPINLAFLALKPSLGFMAAAWVVGAVTLLLGFVGLIFLKETYGKNLNFVELADGTTRQG